MAKIDGYIFHHNPLIYINHGFFSFSPTFYYDFYLINGFEIARYPLIKEKKCSSWDMYREESAPASNNVLIRKIENKSLVWPEQGYHRNHEFLAGLKTLATDSVTSGKIALLPAGTITEAIHTFCEEDLRERLLICDNYKNGTQLNGSVIHPLERILQTDVSAVVITSLSYQDKLVCQAVELGFSKHKVFIYTPDGFVGCDTEDKEQAV